MEDSAHTGYWWVPGNKDSAVSGELKIEDSSEIWFSTMGSLVPGAWKGVVAVAAVNGMRRDGKLITLLGCRILGFQQSMPGMQTQTISARTAVFGVELEEAQALRFFEISFRFTHIEDWIGKHGFSFSSDSGEYQIHYKLPDIFEAKLPDGYELKSRFSVKAPLRAYPLRKAEISEHVWLTLVSPEPLTLLEFWPRLQSLRHFMSLAVGRPVYITELEGRSELVQYEHDGKTYFDFLQIHHSGTDKPQKQSVLDAREMLLPLKSIQDRLDSTLQRWLERIEAIDPAIDLYFSTLYEHFLHPRRHFLFLAQAAETYHRRTSTETEMSRYAHKERMQSISGAVSKEYRSWLRSKLAFSNELTLKTRLEQLCDKFAPAIDGYIERDPFVKLTKNTRNWLTHYDPRLEKKAAKTTAEYVDLIYKLRTLLEACFSA